MEKDRAQLLIAIEYGKAKRKFKDFPTAHHGYGVIKEEFEELWDEIKAHDPKKPLPDAMFLEAIQVGAMALRFLIDLAPEE